MKIGKPVFMVFVSIVIAAILLAGAVKVIHAQSSNQSDSTVISKLDAILKAQASMAGELAAIREDLRIIKIRITQQQ